MVKKVVVFACDTGGLGIIRDLHRTEGIYIIAVSNNKSDIGLYSRYVSEKHISPDPKNDEKAFLDFLLSFKDAWKGALFIETRDNFSIFFAKNKEVLSGYFHIITNDWKILSKVLFKDELYRIADKLNIDYPKSFLELNKSNYKSIADEINYPCLVKPVDSNEFVNVFNTKNFYVKERNDFINKMESCFDNSLSVVAQEVIPGPDENLIRLQSYVNKAGKQAFKFFLYKIRQQPPRFGVGRVCMSTSPVKEIQEIVERVISETGYRGYLSIEFKKDERDGKYKLIEMNVRISRGVWHCIYAGINITEIIMADHLDNKEIYNEHYEENLCWIEIFPDLQNIIFNVHGEKISFQKYFEPYRLKRKVFAVFNTHDFKPFLHQFFNILSGGLYYFRNYLLKGRSLKK